MFRGANFTPAKDRFSTTARDSVMNAKIDKSAAFQAKMLKKFRARWSERSTLRITMKTIISAIIVAGALSQMANAFGPVGDTTHRHFYKDQEWIWQNEQNLSDKQALKDSMQGFSVTHVWDSPLAFAFPNRPPYLAFAFPNRPPYLAFAFPNRPPASLPAISNTAQYLAFAFPNRPPAN